MDWDKFYAEGETLRQRIRGVVERIDRHQEEARREREATQAGPFLVRERPSHDQGGPPAGPFDRFERTLSDISQHVSAIRHDLSLVQRDVAELKGDVAQLKGDVAQLKSDLAHLTQRVESLEREVAQIREQMATRAELESVRGDIRLVAEGFAQTHTRLADVADLMRRHISAA